MPPATAAPPKPRPPAVSVAPRLLLRPDEVAEALAISPALVYRMIRSCELPTVRIGAAVRVPAEALAAWVQGRTDESEAQ